MNEYNAKYWANQIGDDLEPVTHRSPVAKLRPDEPVLFPAGVDYVDCPKCAKRGNHQTAMVNYARTEANCYECTCTLTPKGEKPFLSPDWEKDWWENLSKIGWVIMFSIFALFILFVLILGIGAASNAAVGVAEKGLSPKPKPAG